MRLRLNTTLRAALIAAITAVGFTLTQAQAETATAALTPTTSTSNLGGFGAFEFTVGEDSPYQPSGGTLAYSTADPITLNSVDISVYATWYTNRHSDTGFGGAIYKYDETSSNYVLVSKTNWWKGSSAQYNGTVTLTPVGEQPLVLEQDAVYAVAFYAGESYFNNNLTIGSTTTSFAGAGEWKGTTVPTNTDGLAAVGIKGASNNQGITMYQPGTSGPTTTYSPNVVLNITYTAPPASLWVGTSDQHDWSNAASWNPTFEAGGNVKFDGTGWNVVNVDDVIMAGDVSITSGSYTFMLDSTVLAASSLSVEGTGASLAIQGSGAVSVTDISLGAGNTITASNDAVVSLSSLAAGTGASLVINGTATAELTGDSANALEHISGDGDVHIAADSLFAGSSAAGSPATTHSTGALFVDEGVTLSIGTKDTGAYVHTYVNMESFNKVQLDGSNLYVHNDHFKLNNLTVTSKGGQVIIHDTVGQDYNTLTLAGTTTLNGDLIFSGSWKQQFTIAALAGDGTLKLNGVGHDKQIVNIGGGTVGGLQINKSNVEAHITGDLTVGGLDGTQGTVEVSDGKNLTFNVADGQTHSFTGSLTVGGQIVKTGEGSQTISGTALHHTLDVQAGTLVLNGNFAIDDVAEGDATISYVDASGAESDNGFQNASGTLNVYDTHSSAGTVNLANGHFTYGGKDVTADIQNGVYRLAGEVDYTVLYVNSGSEAIAAYQTAAQDKGKTLSGAVLKDTATLTVDTDFAGSISVASGKGNVVINEGKTVTGTKSNITLTGAGTYALDAGTQSLGTGTTLGQDWTGIVCITSVNQNNIDLSQYVKGTASTVELKGFTGWTNNWSGTITQNIKLTNNGDNAAWSIGAFSSTSQPEATFTGTWSGTGTFKRTSGNNMHYKYTGDISAWEGKFLMDSGNTRLTFAGSASAVNAEIAKNGGTLNVVVDNNAVFSKSVTADSLTVNASKSATFNGTATFGSVTQNAGAAITVGTEGALTIGGGSLTSAITNNGTLTFAGNITATGFEVTPGTSGYVDVNGELSTDGNGFVTTSGDSITIVTNGGTIVNSGNYTVTQNDVAYTIQTDGTATTASGSTDYRTYYQKSGEVAVSQILEASAGAIPPCMNIAVSDTGVLNVDDQFGFINAAGGEVVFTEGGEADMLFVTGDAKVSGLTDYSSMMISAGKTATMEEGITSGNVVFSSTEGGVQVTNTNEQGQITYSTDEAAAQVTADKLTVGPGEAETEISNSLVVGEIVNNNAEGLLLLGNVANGVTLNAAAGDITMVGQTSNTLSVVDLTIAAGKTVELIDGDQTEGTITVTDTLTGGNATLLANLTLVGGSTLDVDGGDTNALTLGSTLTIDLTNGKFVNLDEDTIAALNDLANGESLALIKTGQVDLEYAEDYNGVWYDNMFVRAEGLVGDYQVYANAGSFGLTKSSQVPEPTTGTLSLLALAALAARRRRK